MLRKIETAKKCLCPVMYDANVQAMKGHTLTDEQVKETVNCLADECMAWKPGKCVCNKCGDIYIPERSGGECGVCGGDIIISTGYCKLIFKD